MYIYENAVDWLREKKIEDVSFYGNCFPASGNNTTTAC